MNEKRTIDHGKPDHGKATEHAKDRKDASELSPEEAKKVVGGNLGAPIFKKKP